MPHPSDSPPALNEEPPTVSAATSRTKTPETVSLLGVFLLGWRQLLRSRTRTLREQYLGLIRAQGITISDEVTLEEAREQIAQIPSLDIPNASELEIEGRETKMVLAARLFALWQVFWTSLLPLAVTVWWCSDRLSDLPQQNAAARVITVALLLGFSLFGSILGLLIQAIFVRQFVGAVNWLLR